MRILITKLSSFGDVIAAFPAASDAIAAGVEVDWLVDGAFEHVVKLHPHLRAVHRLDERGTRWRPLTWPRYWRQTWDLKSRLRGAAYDLVVDLQGLLKSALPSRWPDVPVHGYDAHSIREPAASRLYTVRHSISKDLHAVERNRALMAAALGRPAPTGPADFGLSAETGPSPPGLPSAYVVILHSASWPSKLWSEAHWRSLIEAHGDLNFILPWGNDDENCRATRLTAGLPHAQVLADRLTQQPLAGLLASAKVVIGLDSGLMHLANALGAPTLWLFGSTSAVKTGPYGPGAHVVASTNPYSPCLRRECRHADGACMDAISVGRVSDVLTELVA